MRQASLEVIVLVPFSNYRLESSDLSYVLNLRSDEPGILFRRFVYDEGIKLPMKLSQNNSKVILKETLESRRVLCLEWMAPCLFDKVILL